MRTMLLVLLPACAPSGPTEREGGSNNPSDDTNFGGTDDSATPECTPVDYYLDADHDGYGAGDLLSACDPVDAADVAGDCDDADADVHPDRDDACNGIDDDCDLDFDEDAATTVYYADDDGDGYGVDTLTVETCGGPPDGFAALTGDCDDANGAMSPGVAEDWTDGIDDNCDGVLEIETPVDVPEARGNWWDAPTSGTIKLRVVGAYEPGPKHEIAVTHDVPEAVVLVLTSATPASWVVTETYPGTIQQIIVTGAGASTVSGPKDVPVDSYLGGMAWGYAYDFDDGGARTIVENAESLTGLELTSFHGNYRAPSFTISPGTDWMDTSAYPDCLKKPTGTTGGGPDVTTLDPVACVDVLEDAHICVTGSGTTIKAYGLDSGSSCTAATTASSFTDSRAPSIAWSDEWVYACTGEDGMLQRASLLTGAVEKSYLYCSGVANLDGQLYVFDFPSWKTDAPVYDTWENAQCGSPAFYTDTTTNSRIAIHDGVLYSSWHSTDEFEWQVLGGTDSGAATFEDYDGWIQGLDVTDDGSFTFIAEDGIRWYDMEGRARGMLPSSSTVGYGLACVMQ